MKWGIITRLSIWLSIVVKPSTSAGGLFDQSTWYATVKTLIDGGVGALSFQSYLESATTSSQTKPDGLLLLNTMANSISMKINENYGALLNLHRFLTANAGILSSTPSYSACCTTKLTASLYDTAFKQKVNNNSCCSYRAGSKSVSYPPSKIISIFQDNANKIPSLNFQFFAATDGSYVHFPATESSTCNFEPRSRPYFGHSVNLQPRDVILVIDTSVSPTKLGSIPVFNAIRQAALNVISALNSKDRISVLVFPELTLSQGADSLVNLCILTSMADVSERIKADLKSLMNFLVPTGIGQDYAKAINTAFQRLLKSFLPKRNRVISVITAADNIGSDDSSTALKSVLSQSSKLTFGNESKPTLLIYILNPSVSLVFTTYDLSTSYTGQREVKQIISVAEVYRAGTFFQKFLVAANQAVDVIRVTPIYVSYFTAGELVMTISKPVFIRDRFIGVVGIDVVVNELLADLISFQAGGTSYVYLIDQSDNSTLFHPLIPIPSEQGLQPTIVDISLLERGPSAVILNNVTAGGNGSTLINATYRYVAKGNPFNEGVIVNKVDSLYYYKPINASFINWEVVVVIGVDDFFTKLTLKKKPVESDIEFLYHRTDLMVQPISVFCRAFYRRSIRDHSSVKFAPKSFLDPSIYLYKAETKDDIQNYINIVLGRTVNELFVTGVVDDVVLTSYLDNLWINDLLSYDIITYAVWRYIGTERGVFRVYPPIVSEKIYDPTARPWYRKVKSVTDLLVVTAPYLDSFGAGYIQTAAQEIYGPGTRIRFGVMAMDISINYIYLQVETMFYVDCKRDGFRCFIMDTAGYIVSYWRWIYADWSGTPIIVEDAHITSLEPSIAKDMISRGYLKRTTCTNLFDIREQAFYTGNFDEADHMDTNARPSYHALYVKQTNLYIILLRTATRSDTDAPCPCTGAVCALPDIVCECPCYKTAIFEPCEYHFTQNVWTPCPPVPVNPFAVDSSIQAQSTGNSYVGLDFCQPRKCNRAPNLGACHQIANCRWCNYNTKGQQLSQAYCGLYDDCWFGQVGFPNIYTASEQPTATNSLVLLPVFLVVLLLLVGLTLGFLYHRKIGPFAKKKQVDVEKEAPKVEKQPEPIEEPQRRLSKSDFEKGVFRPTKTNAGLGPGGKATGLTAIVAKAMQDKLGKNATDGKPGGKDIKGKKNKKKKKKKLLNKSKPLHMYQVPESRKTESFKRAAKRWQDAAAKALAQEKLRQSEVPWQEWAVDEEDSDEDTNDTSDLK